MLGGKKEKKGGGREEDLDTARLGEER